jgi:stalled ribosome rescue protein Dom34
MSYQHAVVWMDHLRAVVIDFSIDKENVHLVESPTEHRQIHRKAKSIGSGKAEEDHDYFDEIVASIGDAREVLIVGPGVTKTTFAKDLEHRHPAVSKLVVAVEKADHPQVPELLAYARKYFRKIDNLRGV